MAQAREPDESVRYQSFLEKKCPKSFLGLDLEVWQSRFFVLQSRSLLYYKEAPVLGDQESMFGDNLCGEISLSEINAIVPIDDVRFNIEMSNKHKRKKVVGGNPPYELRAKNAEEQHHWLELLRRSRSIGFTDWSAHTGRWRQLNQRARKTLKCLNSQP